MKEIHIDKYTSYFHDGMIHDIKYEKDSINFFMESAQLLPEWNTDHLVLSKRDTLSGILHLENIKNIHINKQPLNEPLKKNYDAINIYHVKIKKNKLTLEISWENYPPKQREETDIFTIDIEAEKIYWDNMPLLFDAEW